MPNHWSNRCTPPRRKSVSLDGETFKIISDWKGHVGLHEKSDSKLIQDNRNFLEWFISTYIKKELEGIFFDATLELSVAGVLTGSLAGFGISLVTLTGGTIIGAIREAPPEIIDPSWKPVLVGFVALVMFACIIVLARPVWMLTKETPTPLSTPSSTSPPVVLLQGTTPSITLTVPISQVASTQILVIETPFPIKSTTIDNSPNYCLYVIQPNDTLQSVAAWFAVSENEIRNSDRLINWGAFTTHQMIRVNTSCCKSISNNGFSYSVQAGDNIFRLSDKYFTTAEKIVAANNLDNSHYIQAGQMLCIPYP
ncbi:MAG: LysM peptidoglycan-binding domain-containing protein [Anaerolineales bacterium]|uniref:LysM peptidoglycan-binding domain-containing protein n=1 Tax=Candidatus Villigracilis proximus TaxID=3140683 RepID=UPI003135965A|nr:LysM peptidoglycan-binding domain-containing protein [Anaerolineales bacterium]